MKRKNRKKELKKGVLKICYRCFIITCFIISIVCLFKHQKVQREVQRYEDISQQTVYMIQNEEKDKLIEDLKNGKVDLSQNVPIPDDIKEQRKKEAEEKKKKEEEERKKQEAIKLAKQKEEAEKKKKVQITSRGSSTTRQSSTQKSSGTKAEYQAYAKDLCLNTYGWTENDFNCLVKLWNRESGWNPNAHNSSSGAHGIPQSLPASKMSSEGADYYTNGETQIRWGLKYIKNRYGNPSNAWAHSQKKGWY